MRLMGKILIATLLSGLTSYAHACAVDSVQSKTDTTITISFDVSGCNHLGSGEKFEVCWKNTGDWDFPCGADSRHRSGESSGTITITELSPSTSYKVRTKRHSTIVGWVLVTNRIVTTNPSPTSSSAVLRYVKGSGNPYSVDFFWSNSSTQPSMLTLHLQHKSLGSLGVWVSSANQDLTNATLNLFTGEYTINITGFNVGRRYRAQIYQKSGDQSSVTNRIEWY